MTEILGCQDCAELTEVDEFDVSDYVTCDHCGGRLLCVQEAFDMILHLKRTLEAAGVEYEFED